MVRPLCSNHAAARGFHTTRWSLVAAAGEPPPASSAALAELCQLYWPPIYAFVRRYQRDPQAALDLTQGFFAQLLEHNDLARVDAKRGRFRSWLLAALKHFLANERRRARAQKRGGGAAMLSIDAIDVEERWVEARAGVPTPEQLYHRRWALAVLDRVMDKLDLEHVQRGKREWFERLKIHIVGEEPSYDALAGELGVAPATLRVQVHRLRRRYHSVLRAEIAETVEAPEDVDHELRDLFAALL